MIPTGTIKTLVPAPSNGLATNIAIRVVYRLAFCAGLLLLTTCPRGGNSGIQEPATTLRNGDGLECMLVVVLSAVDDAAVVVLAHAGFAQVEVDADFALERTRWSGKSIQRV